MRPFAKPEAQHTPAEAAPQVFSATILCADRKRNGLTKSMDSDSPSQGSSKLNGLQHDHRSGGNAGTSQLTGSTGVAGAGTSPAEGAGTGTGESAGAAVGGVGFAGDAKWRS